MSDKIIPEVKLDRRQLVAGAGGLGMAAAASIALNTPQAHAAKTTPESLKGDYLDLTTPRGNMLAMARMEGDLDGSTDYGWYSGVVMGVRQGEPVRDLFRFEGFSAKRLVPLEDEPGYQKLLREVGYYVDIETGEIMEEWENVYTGETVKTVPVANDPFNFKIREYFPPPPNYGGLNETETVKIPMILPWEPRGEIMNLDRHIHLYYPSALQPDKWPRESPGPFTRVSEHFMYNFKTADIQDESKTRLRYNGTWCRITPWLPWMLMDQAEGHIVYQCFMGGGLESLDELDPKLVSYTDKNYTKFLEAPEKYEEPSLSSLENYAREQQPAPPREG